MSETQNGFIPPEISTERQGDEKEKEIAETEKEKQTFVDGRLHFWLSETAVFAGEGKRGVVFKIEENDPQIKKSFAEFGYDLGDNQASKIIKIFTLGTAEKEIGLQQQAYNIISEAKKQFGTTRPMAHIPRFILQHETEVDEKMRAYLKAQKFTYEGDRAEIILMEFIKGEDLAHLLNRKIIELYPLSKITDDFLRARIEKSKENQGLTNFPIDDLILAVSDILELHKIPKGDSTPETITLMAQNSKKLYEALRVKGFTLPEEIYDQVKNTILELHKNNFYHRDLHERNIMISETEKQAYIIDFGESVFDSLYSPEDTFDGLPPDNQVLIGLGKISQRTGPETPLLKNKLFHQRLDRKLPQDQGIKKFYRKVAKGFTADIPASELVNKVFVFWKERWEYAVSQYKKEEEINFFLSCIDAIIDEKKLDKKEFSSVIVALPIEDTKLQRLLYQYADTLK